MRTCFATGRGRPFCIRTRCSGAARRDGYPPFFFLAQEDTTMVYTKRTKEALKMAYHAHHGQTDKTGLPYIYHPLHLAEQMTDVHVGLLVDWPSG